MKRKTPGQKARQLRDHEERAVFRDGLSEDSYQKLKDANGHAALKEVLLDIFEPSAESEDGDDE